eukprot:12560275-Ditylum_brightwellii.AAC.1
MQSVNTTLGGGANSHLGLVSNASIYASIPGTIPYICPVNSGPLAIPVRTMQFQIAHACDQHQEALHLFREVTNDKITLVKQIVKDVDAKYLTAICNPVTNEITCTIGAFFDYLFDTY